MRRETAFDIALTEAPMAVLGSTVTVSLPRVSRRAAVQASCESLPSFNFPIPRRTPLLLLFDSNAVGLRQSPAETIDSAYTLSRDGATAVEHEVRAWNSGTDLRNQFNAEPSALLTSGEFDRAVAGTHGDCKSINVGLCDELGGLVWVCEHNLLDDSVGTGLRTADRSEL